MRKGEATKAAILDEATQLASRVGLGGLTIGTLATATELSKSGLYAHFASKEALQVEALRHASGHFIDRVMRPTLTAPRGEARLRTFFERWLDWQSTGYEGGCIFVDAASEFDDQEGPVRDELVRTEQDKREAVVRIVATAISEGQFRPDVDPEQLAYELEGIMLAHHHSRRLMRDVDADRWAWTAFERLVRTCHVADSAT